MSTRKVGDAQRRQLLLEMYRDLCRVHRSFQVETVAQELLRSLHQHFRVDGAALALLNASGEEVLQCFLLGARDAEVAKGQEPLWFGYDKRSLLNFLRDMLPRRLESPKGREHKVGGVPLAVHWVVPMDLNYGISALLLAGASDADTLGAAEFEMCEPIFNEMGFALRNANYVQRIQDLTTKDDLTLAYNRRFFETFLDEEVTRARRFGNPLSVIFLDLDGLRSVNDRFGHATGSRTLQEVAARLLKNVRSIDKVFRYGGDEFVIVLPETDAEGAYGVAERMRNVLNMSTFLVEETGGLHITGSSGIAQFPVHASTKDELVKKADAAMYRIKTTQKDDILIAETTPAPKK